MLLEEIKNIKSSKKDLRSFGLAVGGVLAILGGILLYRGKPTAPWFLGVGIFLMTVGLVFPPALKPIQKIWMAFAVIMGWVSSRVVLTLLFYAVVTPVGVVARGFGKTFLDLEIDKTRKSYWNLRENKVPDKMQYEKQF